ncbi:MAG: hypothetical protein J6I73_00540 [Treponema sp.]|nr:hypothetical protein [Treponema sp.]
MKRMFPFAFVFLFIFSAHALEVQLPHIAPFYTPLSDTCNWNLAFIDSSNIQHPAMLTPYETITVSTPKNKQSHLLILAAAFVSDFLSGGDFAVQCRDAYATAKKQHLIQNEAGNRGSDFGDWNR